MDEFIPPEYKQEALFFNLDFNLEDPSSTMVLTARVAQEVQRLQYRV